MVVTVRFQTTTGNVVDSVAARDDGALEALAGGASARDSPGRHASRTRTTSSHVKARAP
jgi:hypothetical protein